MRYLKLLYREQFPQVDGGHLGRFVDQFLGPNHRIWWAHCQNYADSIGCLWLGYTSDPVEGDRHPYIFLLYVVPEYRRLGIGKTLVTLAEDWARQGGYSKLSLHVFCENAAGQQLYSQLDYQPRSVLLQKPLQKTGSPLANFSPQADTVGET